MTFFVLGNKAIFESDGGPLRDRSPSKIGKSSVSCGRCQIEDQLTASFGELIDS